MRYLLLCCCFPALLSAQSNFLKDPDIVWAKEIEMDWVVDVASFENEWEFGISTQKLLRTAQNDAYWKFPFLSALVFKDVEAGKLTIFSDAKCLQPVSASEALFHTDTVVTFDPETYEEKTMIIHAHYDPYQEVKTWRVREILAYNQKTARWSAQVEAVAPLRIIRTTEGDSVGIQPFFWIPVGQKTIKLSNNNIVWAKQVKSRAPYNYFRIDDGTPVKITDGFKNPLEHQIKVLGNDLKTPFYDYLNEKPLTPAERSAMLVQVDTVVTFDPETYEEKVQVVRNELNTDDIQQIRLVHQWYWDEKRSRLSIVLEAVGMMHDVTKNLNNYYGEFRYTTPFFYRRVRPK